MPADCPEVGAPAARKGMPVWGWVLIGCGGLGLLAALVVGLLALLAVPALQRSSKAAMRVRCMSSLRQIGLACQLYAAEHDAFPPDLASLQPKYVDNPKIFWCPASGNYRPGKVSYGYLPGRDPGLPPDFVLAFDESPENHGGEGFSVLYCDGNVEWKSGARFADFEALLKDQDETVGKIRKDPGNRAKYLGEYRRLRPRAAGSRP